MVAAAQLCWIFFIYFSRYFSSAFFFVRFCRRHTHFLRTQTDTTRDESVNRRMDEKKTTHQIIPILCAIKRLCEMAQNMYCSGAPRYSSIMLGARNERREILSSVSNAGAFK